jgi:hypothetical protein
LASDDDAGYTASYAAKATLQDIVDDLATYGPSRSVDELCLRLEAAIAEAGLPEQPAPWVKAVAREASAGRVTILDARFAQGPAAEE